jgi:YcaO-like protein with predicted kinase domain
MGNSAIKGHLWPMIALTTTNDAKRYYAGTHRVTDPRTTLINITPKLASVGVTRIADVTGLDYIGIPVVMSVRPASRSLSVHQGKGLTLDDAKVSAIMESVEFFCGEQPHENVWHSLKTLKDCEFVLPRHLMRRPLRHDTIVPWVKGHDLLKDVEVLVPEELCMIDFSRPQAEGYGWFRMTSNGVASGNTINEALLHAICEVVERDALALWFQAPASHQDRSRIDVENFGDQYVSEYMARYSASGMVVNVWETTSDLGIPSFFCLVDDRDAVPPFLGRSGGSGCHPSSAIALCRALAEAAQSRLTLIVGARDDIAPEHYLMIGWDHNIASLLATQTKLTPAKLSDSRGESIHTNSISDDLEAVLTRLQNRGVDRVIVIDLMQPDVGIPCVRVVIPDLEGMHNKPGYKPGKRAKCARRTWQQ